MAMDGQGHLLNESQYKHFLNCYWRDFHPFFPIVHYSALALAPPPPLLALMMVTIGAMISSSPAPSVTFYRSCVGFFTTVSLGLNLLFLAKTKKNKNKNLILSAAAPRNYDEFSIIGYADGYSAGGLFQVLIKGSKM